MRIGIIGFGNMGQSMAAAFTQATDAQIVGVADVAPAGIRVAEEQGLSCYTDYRTLLAQSLDGVYIATPNALHRENVLAAAAVGIPIFCEKPIAITVAEAEEMVRATEAAGVPTLVNFIYRFADAYERLRAYYTSGQLGNLLACWFRTFRGYGFYGAGARHPAITHPELSGGWVVHHAIHAVDWLISIGGPVASVAARSFRSTPEAPSPEGILGLLTFAGGAVAHVADAVVALREHPAGIVGTRGSVTFDHSGIVRFCPETGDPKRRPEETTPGDYGGYLIPAAQHFVAVARGEVPARATLRDGLYALRVTHALLEADRTGETVWLLPRGVGGGTDHAR